MAHCNVKQVAWRDTWRVLVVILRAVSRYLDPCGSSSRWSGTAAGRIIAQRGSQRRKDPLATWTGAEESNRRLLVSIERQRSRKVRNRSGHQTAVITPVEAHPRSALPGLILQVSRRVELLVVVDAEHGSTLPNRYPEAPNLRREIARRDAGHHHQRRKSVEIRHAGADCVSGNLRIMPIDRKGNRRIAQHAEVVRVVCVLPQILGIHH